MVNASLFLLSDKADMIIGVIMPLDKEHKAIL